MRSGQMAASMILRSAPPAQPGRCWAWRGISKVILVGTGLDVRTLGSTA